MLYESFFCRSVCCYFSLILRESVTLAYVCWSKQTHGHVEVVLEVNYTIYDTRWFNMVTMRTDPASDSIQSSWNSRIGTLRVQGDSYVRE